MSHTNMTPPGHYSPDFSPDQDPDIAGDYNEIYCF
jgi:hypothetical protein